MVCVFYKRKHRRDGFLSVLSLVVHPIVHVAASGRFLPGQARRAAESIRVQHTMDSVLQTRASGRVFFRNERQEGWLEDLESTFRHFGRVTNEIPFDNDRGFVSRRAVATREVTLTQISGLRSRAPATGLRSASRTMLPGRQPVARLARRQAPRPEQRFGCTRPE